MIIDNLSRWMRFTHISMMDDYNQGTQAMKSQLVHIKNVGAFFLFNINREFQSGTRINHIIIY
jgi:hypothetical protein